MNLHEIGEGFLTGSLHSSVFRTTLLDIQFFFVLLDIPVGRTERIELEMMLPDTCPLRRVNISECGDIYRLRAITSILSFRCCRIFSRSEWLFENLSPNRHSSVLQTSIKMTDTQLVSKSNKAIKMEEKLTFRLARDHFDCRKYLCFVRFRSHFPLDLSHYSCRHLSWTTCCNRRPHQTIVSTFRRCAFHSTMVWCRQSYRHRRIQIGHRAPVNDLPIYYRLLFPLNVTAANRQ